MWDGGKITATYVSDRPSQTIPRASPVNSRAFTGAVDRLNLTITTFGANWSSESRYGWNRADRQRLDCGFEIIDPIQQEATFGGRRVPDVRALGFRSGTGGETVCECSAPHWSFDQKIAYHFGKHSVKFGGMLFRSQMGRTNIENPRFVCNTEEFFALSSKRGRPGFDITHTFVSNFVYDLPSLDSLSSSVARQVIGGWQMSGIVSARSGRPLTVTQPSAHRRSRPDIVDFDNATLDSGDQYLNPAAFAMVPINSLSGATVRLGSAGRSAIDGPGFFNADFSVSKNFPISETMKLRFGVDMFNVFNHTNWVRVATDIRRSSFGLRTATGQARQMQFTLRLNF